jgi:hypothetical protein
VVLGVAFPLPPQPATRSVPTDSAEAIRAVRIIECLSMV